MGGSKGHNSRTVKSKRSTQPIICSMCSPQASATRAAWRGKLGSAMVPCSTKILDRTTGALVPCAPGVCSDNYIDPATGETRACNRAPYFGGPLHGVLRVGGVHVMGLHKCGPGFAGLVLLMRCRDTSPRLPFFFPACLGTGPASVSEVRQGPPHWPCFMACCKGHLLGAETCAETFRGARLCAYSPTTCS